MTSEGEAATRESSADGQAPEEKPSHPDGRALERSVAEACRKLGYEITVGTECPGQQCDVIARRQSSESGSVEIVLECKDWVNPVSNQEVQNFVYTVHSLRSRATPSIHAGVMVSRKGFSDRAKAVVDPEHHVKLLTLEDLERMTSPRELEKDILSADIELRNSVMSYLRSMIDKLGSDNWPNLAHHGPTLQASYLERPLKVKMPDGKRGDSKDAYSVANNSHHLVILAGPGTGKTWLARRIARKAAQQALGDLESGDRVDNVRLPLLLTCNKFMHYQGNMWKAAIEPSLIQFSPEPPCSLGPLEEHLQNRRERVLLVLDSLDEAAPGGRNISEALISNWDVVLTSRHHAWNDAYWPETTIKAELQELSYPSDVREFARKWFGATRRGNSASPLALEQEAEEFMNLLAGNPAARDLCTIPLFLTFLCIVRSSESPDRDLPRTRTELLNQVVIRTLKGHWRVPDNHRRDDRTLMKLAQDWAWQAKEDNPVSGLSEWQDTFYAASPSETEVAGQDFWRIDAVFPPQGLPDPGSVQQVVERGFVHRVVREHLVAMHVAAMPTSEAIEQLAEHWWFDENWEYIIPTVIVKQDRCDPSEFLSAVRKDTATGGITPDVRKVLDEESARKFLHVCAESEPSNWDDDNRAQLHAVREKNAVRLPSLVARSWHWHDSNPAVITALASADKFSAEIVRALADAATTEETRAVGRKALPGFLPRAGYKIDIVARTLVALDPSEKTRAATVRTLAAHLRKDTGAVLRVMAYMATTEETRAVARKALANFLSTSSIWTADVARSLISLATSEKALADAVDALAACLAAAAGVPVPSCEVHEVIQALASAATTEETRAAARKALVDSMPRMAHSETGTADVARALVQVGPTPDDAVDALAICLASVPRHRDGQARAIVQALADVATTETTRAKTREILTNFLLHAGCATDAVVRALVTLDPSDENRAATVDALTSSSYISVCVARALTSLATTDTSRASAVDALAASLTDADVVAGDIAQALADVATTVGTRAVARKVLSDFLSRAGSATHAVARALVQVDPSEATLDAAVAALAACLRDADIDADPIAQADGDLDDILIAQAYAELDAIHIVRALADVATTVGTRAVARKVLSDFLSRAGRTTHAVARALVQVDPSEVTLDAAVAALAACLRSPREVIDDLDGEAEWYFLLEVIGAFSILATTDKTRNAAVAALADFLPIIDCLAPYCDISELAGYVARVLASLATTETSRDSAVGALADYLSNNVRDTDDVQRARISLDINEEIIQALISLAKTERSRDIAVDALADYLLKVCILPEADTLADTESDKAWLSCARDVVDALASLAATNETRDVIVGVLVEYLPDAGRLAGDIARVLASLATDETLDTVIDALAECLSGAYYEAGDVARALASLATDETLDTVIDALAECLSGACDQPADIARVLASLATDETRDAIVDALIKCLPGGRYEAGYIARALAHVATTKTSCAVARDALSRFLPCADRARHDVAVALRAVCEPSEWVKVIRP